MQDMMGHDLQVGDKVVVCHTGGTNSTLVTGRVNKLNHKSVTVTVENPGSYSYRSFIVEGTNKSVTVPHRVFCYEPVLPPTTSAEVAASRQAMEAMVAAS